MRVGLFAGGQSGGGFTFEMDILSALSGLVGQSHHEFVLLAPSVKNYKYLQRHFNNGIINIPILSKVTSSKKTKKHFFEKVSTSVYKRLGLRKKHNDKPDEEIVQTMETLARENGIQVIWFVDQTYEYVPDVPYLATLWDLQHRLQPFFPEVSERGDWEHREKGLSRYLQRAAIVIAGSQTASSEIERFYQVPRERIKILPHPTPKFAITPPVIDDNDILNRYDISAGYLFYPAQFWAHKNHINLLLALNVLRERYGLSLNTIFVGSDRGNEVYVRQKIEELNLASQVKILGFVPQSDLIALYRHALALTYVTFFGPDNLPPLEAFALKCPVIASNVSGAQEQLGNSALLVDPRDPEDIALAVQKIYKSTKLRSTLIQRGRKRAADWTGDDFIRGVFAILDEIEPFRRSWS